MQRGVVRNLEIAPGFLCEAWGTAVLMTEYLPVLIINFKRRFGAENGYCCKPKLTTPYPKSPMTTP